MFGEREHACRVPIDEALYHHCMMVAPIMPAFCQSVSLCYAEQQHIDLGNGTTKRTVTHGTQRAAAVLRAIGITDLDPPTPPIPGQTVM
jgi:hypothetical protein